MKKKLNYILSIDQGSTSTRTVVYDENLTLVCTSQREIKEFYPNKSDAEEILGKTLIEWIKNKYLWFYEFFDY